MPWLKELTKKELATIDVSAGRKLKATEFRKLLYSIEEVGVLEPVILRKTSAGYRVLSGFQRLRVAKKLMEDGVLMKNIKIRAVVAAKNTPPQTFAAMAAVTNIPRWDLDVYDRAKIVAKFANKSGAEWAAKVIGLSRRSVINMISIRNLLVDAEKQKAIVELKDAAFGITTLIKLASDYQAKKKAAEKLSKSLPNNSISSLILTYLSEKKAPPKKDQNLDWKALQQELQTSFDASQIRLIFDALDMAMEKPVLRNLGKSA